MKIFQKMKDFFVRIFLIFPDFSGFDRFFNFLSQFWSEKDKFFIFIFCKKFIYFLYFFLLFLGFSAKFSTKKIVPILEISQGQCPRNPIFLLLKFIYLNRVRKNE